MQVYNYFKFCLVGNFRMYTFDSSHILFITLMTSRFCVYVHIILRSKLCRQHSSGTLGSTSGSLSPREVVLCGVLLFSRCWVYLMAKHYLETLYLHKLLCDASWGFTTHRQLGSFRGNQWEMMMKQLYVKGNTGKHKERTRMKFKYKRRKSKKNRKKRKLDRSFSGLSNTCKAYVIPTIVKLHPA